jgi:glycerol-3-phosphate dehydrogenase subunit C
LPLFPKESFFLWAKKKKLSVLNDKKSRARSKVAYFAGCSAGYLFPEVGKAAVRILEQNGVEVFVPPQECCSMPLVMEGDETSAFKKINTNIETLLEAVHQGYDIVCSCPTCGYFFRKLLLEKARYSEAFQEKTADNSKVIKVPLGSGKRPFTTVSKGAYQKLLKDDGYFSAIDPLKRIELSSKVKDLGEYLLSIQEKRKLKTKQSGAGIPMVYYAPCHQRELQIGQPYYHLLKSLPDSDIIQTRGAMQCCGMGGHLGYRKSFHSHTLSIGEPLFEQLLSEKDRIIITDCSSCKIQLQQALSRKVFHPLELL